MKLLIRAIPIYCPVCKNDLSHVSSTPERVVWSHASNSCENANKLFETPPWMIEAKEI